MGNHVPPYQKKVISKWARKGDFLLPCFSKPSLFNDIRVIISDSKVYYPSPSIQKGDLFDFFQGSSWQYKKKKEWAHLFLVETLSMTN